MNTDAASELCILSTTRKSSPAKAQVCRQKSDFAQRLTSSLGDAGFFVCKLKKLSNTKKESAGKDADGEPEPEVNGMNGIADASGVTVAAQSPAVGGKKRPIKRKGPPERVGPLLNSLP